MGCEWGAGFIESRTPLTNTDARRYIRADGNEMENYLEIIGEWVDPKGNLSWGTPTVIYGLDNPKIYLSGSFTADDLRALAHYMDPYGEREKGK